MRPGILIAWVNEAVKLLRIARRAAPSEALPSGDPQILNEEFCGRVDALLKGTNK